MPIAKRHIWTEREKGLRPLPMGILHVSIYGNWLGMVWKGELMKCNPEGGQVAFCCTMAIFWAPANLES